MNTPVPSPNNPLHRNTEVQTVQQPQEQVPSRKRFLTFSLAACGRTAFIKGISACLAVVFILIGTQSHAQNITAQQTFLCVGFGDVSDTTIAGSTVYCGGGLSWSGLSATQITMTWYMDGASLGSLTLTGIGASNAGYTIYQGSGPSWVATAGAHTLTFKVDTPNAIAETNESDNTVTRSFVVGSTSGPANDNFANAALLSTNSGTVNSSNVGATTETGEPAHYNRGPFASVWYKFTPASNGTFSFDTHGSAFDTVLAIYTGTSVGSLTLVASNDDDGSTGNNSGLTAVSLTAGTTYRIAVAGYNSTSTGSLVLNWTVANPVLSVAVSPASVMEDGASNLVFTFTRAGVTAAALTANFSVGGTAAFGTDYAQSGAASYSASAGTVTFAAGASTAVVTIDPTADTAVESNETVILTATVGTGYMVGTPNPATGTITNDDSLAGMVQLSATTYSVNETGGNVTITATRTSGSSGAASVNYSTSSGTATAGSDFTTTSGTLSWADGDSTPKSFTIAILDDSIFEGKEMLTVTLSGATIATLSTPSKATITILDDELVPPDAVGWVPAGIGTNGVVSACVADGAGNIYVGGTFTQAGSVAANRVAKWNGSSWTSLGVGFDGAVNALALDSAGNLYAGGVFTTAGGNPANHVAKWNGTGWSSLGDGVGRTYDYGVRALVVDYAGRLYLAFQIDDMRAEVWKWNGSVWTNLGQMNYIHPTYGFLSAYLYSLAADASGNIYAGGTFTKASGVAAQSVAKWDGTQWTNLGAGVAGIVYSMAFDAAGNLYAGGHFSTAGSSPANSIAKWDGSNWTSLGGGIDPSSYMEYSVKDLVFDAYGNLYAGGWFAKADGVTVNNIAKWGGQSWTNLGSGIWGDLTSMAQAPGNLLYVAGNFTLAGGEVANNVAYAILPPPVPGTLQLSAATYSVNESGGSVTITATRTGGSLGAATVSYSTLSGTATAGSDFTTASGMLSWANGDATPRTFTVAILNDTNSEGNETFTATLSGATGATLGSPTSATVTIADNDTTPSVQWSAASQSGAESVGTMTVTAQLSAVSGLAVTVPFTVGGTAANPADYAITASPITIAAGATSGSATITVVNDSLYESSETVVLTMGTPTNATLGTTTVHTATITDDDTTVSVAVAPTSVLEDGASNLVHTFTRAGVTTGALTANFTVGGTATLTTDYTQSEATSYSASTGTVTFAAGVTTATVTIDPVVDTTVEPDETVILTVTTGTGYTVGTPSVAIGTITDDVTASAQTIKPKQLYAPNAFASTEGNTLSTIPFFSSTNNRHQQVCAASQFPAGNLVITSMQSRVFKGTSGWTLMTKATVPGLTLSTTSRAPDALSASYADNVGSDASLVFNAIDGQTFSAFVAQGYQWTWNMNFITPFHYSPASGNLLVDLSGKGSSTLGFISGAHNETSDSISAVYGDATQTQGTITTSGLLFGFSYYNTDLPLVTFQPQDLIAEETGLKAARFLIARSGPTTNALTVNLTVGGTAVAGTDYENLPTNVIIPAGQSSVEMIVRPIGDTVAEQAETVIVTLSNTTLTYNVTTTDSLTVHINDDDSPVRITTASTLPGATSQTLYSQALGATGGTAPYTWTVNTGSTLPTWLSLGSDGVLTGTPTTAGTYYFAIKATDATSIVATKAFSLTAAPGNLNNMETWRQANFGNPANSGNGADLNDFDKDGIPNILEYAFGLNPKQNSAGLLPMPQQSGNNFVVTFTQPSGVGDITYGAEWSQSLLAGSWTAVADTGNTGSSPPQHTFSVPIGTKTKLYMRLKVTNPNP